MAWINLQLSLLFSKKTVGLMCLFVLISVVIYVTQANLQLSISEMDCYREFYAQEFLNASIMATKFITVTIHILIISQSCSNQANRFALLLITGQPSKIPFLLSKCLAFLLATALFSLTQGFLLTGLILIFTPYRYPAMTLINLLASIYLEAVVFAFVQMILMKLTGLALSSAIPLCLYWAMEYFEASFHAVMRPSWLRLLHNLFPHLIQDQSGWKFIASPMMIICVGFFWFFLSIFLYLKSDWR
ncbi:MAG: hypothetical protein PHT56_02550 [Candidatus Izemoplasmatales bacterium]|nr:hypothetical protein [Candidatus Izemoplasmatales bacterium]MDD5601728.1 hypothetical protein [Candidatus Izemoplasmatales bacterium]